MPDVLIVGASTRAAGFSARRAELRPWCADLFQDADLRAQCAFLPLTPGRYPDGLLQAAHQAPPGPWLYTGALENRPALVRRLARRRPLWGNDAPVLALIRSPRWVAGTLAAAGIPCPALSLEPPDEAPSEHWLVKKLAGAGGAGIAFHTGRGPAPSRKRVYYQEYIDGEAAAAIYLGDGRRAYLLGATRQLVGEPWLHAAPFHYCGSLGPLPLGEPLRRRLEGLGHVLVRGSGLRGLFGVDVVLRDEVPWPVEVNPRYCASVEVLEYAGNFSALALHRSVFDPGAPAPLPSLPLSGVGRVGKAILFAREPLTFPADGPWQASLRQSDPVHDLPAFADIPPAGQVIAQGAPILTLFARADSLAACLDALQQTAADLDHHLFGR
jgi:predicted ATP-grasp superfamily ATP-dependent carboligase